MFYENNVQPLKLVKIFYLWPFKVWLNLSLSLILVSVVFWYLYHFSSSGLLDPGMLVNIQQPVIQADGTLLLATDTKVTLFSMQVFLMDGDFFYTVS